MCPAAAVVVAGKAGKTGPGQTKPRLGTTGKPAKPKQLGSGPWRLPGGSRHSLNRGVWGGGAPPGNLAYVSKGYVGHTKWN